MFGSTLFIHSFISDGFIGIPFVCLLFVFAWISLAAAAAAIKWFITILVFRWLTLNENDKREHDDIARKNKKGTHKTNALWVFTLNNIDWEEKDQSVYLFEYQM